MLNKKIIEVDNEVFYMKISIFLYFLLVTLYNFAKLNLLLTIYMITLILTIIGILLVYQLKKFKKMKYIINEIKSIFNITCNIYINFILLFGLIYLLLPQLYNNNLNLLFQISFFFFIIVNIVLYVNYFGITNLNFKKNLKKFFNSLDSVLNRNIPLNLSLIHI